MTRSVPQSPMEPHGLPMHHMGAISQPASQPCSPYFHIADADQEPSRFSLDNTHTPTTQLPLSMPPSTDPYAFEDPTKPPSNSGFDFLPLDYGQGGLFGNHDPEIHGHGGDANTPTPSLMTEASFLVEGSVPALMSCGTSRETSTFQ